MSERKIVVPDGMLQASEATARKFLGGNSLTESNKAQVVKLLEAALRWLSENPIVPTEQMLDELITEFPPSGFCKP